MAKSASDKRRLMSKLDMLKESWSSFERYPKNNSSIVLHICGHNKQENKNLHDFVQIDNFDAVSFDKTAFTPKANGILWNYSWRYTKELTK